MRFGKKSPVYCVDTLRGKNFSKITLSHTVSEIHAFLNLTQIFKMAVQNDGKMIFGKNCKFYCEDILRVKSFTKIALSHTVSEINASLHYMQKFKMFKFKVIIAQLCNELQVTISPCYG